MYVLYSEMYVDNDDWANNAQSIETDWSTPIRCLQRVFRVASFLLLLLLFCIFCFSFHMSVATLYIKFWLGKDVFFLDFSLLESTAHSQLKPKRWSLAMSTRWRGLLQSHLAGHTVNARILRQFIHGGFWRTTEIAGRERERDGKNKS